MKSILRTVLLTSCLALVPAHGALADGKGSESPFSSVKKDNHANETKSSETSFDSVIDELVSTSHEETERHSRAMSDYDLQRMELVHDIANSPLANSPPIQKFLQQYDQANTREAREEAAYQLSQEFFRELMKMITLSLDNNSDEHYISTDFADVYKAAVKLASVEAMLLHRAKLHARSSCSSKQLEDLRKGGGQQASELLPSCYETAQR